MADEAERRPGLTLTTLGVGAAASPRFAPAGLLVEMGARRVMLDGGPGSDPRGPLTAWLVTDERSELIARIRALGRALERRSSSRREIRRPGAPDPVAASRTAASPLEVGERGPQKPTPEMGCMGGEDPSYYLTGALGVEPRMGDVRQGG